MFRPTRCSVFAYPLILLRFKRPLLPRLNAIWSLFAPHFWSGVATPNSRASISLCPTRNSQPPPAPNPTRPCLLCAKQSSGPRIRQAHAKVAHKARLKRLITLSRHPHWQIMARSRTASNAALCAYPSSSCVVCITDFTSGSLSHLALGNDGSSGSTLKRTEIV